jgi:glycosyltransferase involved in cell wall biosynthesis
VNLLILSERSFPRHPGGAGKSTHVLAAELARRGHRVAILCECSEADEVEIIDRVTVHRLNIDTTGLVAPALREAAATARFLRYVEEKLDPENLDLVYDSGGFLSFFFQLARALKEKYGVAYLLHYRYLVAHHRSFVERGASEPFSRHFLGPDKNSWETSQCAPARIADLVLCPSQFQADFVEQHYRPTSGSAKVLPEPVELSPPDPLEVQALRAEIAPPDSRLVFFGGRIDSALKNPDLVAKAFVKILAREPRARLVLQVKSPGVPPAFKRMQAEVIARPWVTDPAQLAITLAAMDVGLVPSSYESFGLMCAELLAAGTPVVASPVGAMREMIDHGKNGFLLTSDRRGWVDQIAAHCSVLLAHPELRRGLRDAAQSSVAGYSIESIGAQAERLCELAIRKRSAAAAHSGPLRPPRFSTQDEKRYLRLLEARLGPKVAGPAAEVIAGWGATADERCRACTRSRLARSQLGLLRPKPFGRLWGKLTGTWPRWASNAVVDVCPLGLVQVDLLKREG